MARTVVVELDLEFRKAWIFGAKIKGELHVTPGRLTPQGSVINSLIDEYESAGAVGTVTVGERRITLPRPRPTDE